MVGRCVICNHWIPLFVPLQWRTKFNEEKRRAEPALTNFICACDKRQWIFYICGTANRYNKIKGYKLLTKKEQEEFYRQHLKRFWQEVEKKV